mmetsp:Transcript_406/g.799  ORF Transcript_406/g.799 Transcript_406/m.799 type:complete len:224 (-) Transcript_406:9-680(-)
MLISTAELYPPPHRLSTKNEIVDDLVTGMAIFTANVLPLADAEHAKSTVKTPSSSSSSTQKSDTEGATPFSAFAAVIFGVSNAYDDAASSKKNSAYASSVFSSNSIHFPPFLSDIPAAASLSAVAASQSANASTNPSPKLQIVVRISSSPADTNCKNSLSSKSCSVIDPSPPAAAPPSPPPESPPLGAAASPASPPDTASPPSVCCLTFAFTFAFSLFSPAPL